MILRPRLHDLYVGRVVLATVLLTWAVLEPHRKEESRGKPPKVPDILKKG